MVDWIKDDLTFTDGFEAHLPEEVRDYAKGYKTLPEALKAGLEAKREFRDRVKLPADDEAKRKFIKEHFQPLLDADAAAAKKQADETAAKDKQRREEETARAQREQLEKAEKTVRTLLGEDAKEFDKQLELCRRVVRSDYCPAWIKDGIAQAAALEADKVTDDHIRAAVRADPAVAQTLQTIARLTANGRLEAGGTGGTKVEERYPAYPRSPEVYAKAADSDPEKKWFVNRGAIYQDGKYKGGYGAAR